MGFSPCFFTVPSWIDAKNNRKNPQETKGEAASPTDRQVAASTFAIENVYRIDFNGTDSCAGRSLSNSSDFASNVEITTNPTAKMLLIIPVSFRLFEATRDSIANNGNLEHFDRQSN